MKCHKIPRETSPCNLVKDLPRREEAVHIKIHVFIITVPVGLMVRRLNTSVHSVHLISKLFFL